MSDYYLSFFAIELSNLISDKVGCVTRAEMRLADGRLYVHTCCHGWVEIEGLLSGKIKRPPEGFD